MPNARSSPVRTAPRSGRRDYTVPSVAAATRILRWLAGRRGSLSEISEALSISKSTAFAILRTLHGDGLVRYDEESRRYALGMALLSLGEAAANQLDHLASVTPLLSGIVAQTGLTGLVAQPTDDGLLIVHKEEGTADVRATMSVGQVVPLGAGGIGKAHAAFTAPERRRRWRPIAFTPRSIVDPARYAAELAAARRRGYATSFEEYRLGVNAVAAPVFDRDGRVVLLVSLIGFASSLTRENAPGYGERLAGLAATASRRLGWRASAAG